MNSLSLAVVLLALVSLAAQAEEIPEEKKAAIEELMQLTGAEQVGDQVIELFTAQMVEALRVDYPDLPDTIRQLIEDEVSQVVNGELRQGTLQKTIYPIYAKYFSVEEIRELIAFNNSDLGRKANRLMPQLLDESSLAAQQWGMGLRVKLIERVSQRLQDNGLKIPGEPRATP
jgi:hypothetical protein